MRKKYNKKELLVLLEDHKEHIDGTADWERYRKGKDLPHFQTLIDYFGSWNELKSLLGLKLNKQNRPQKYSDKKLYQILEEHKAHYTSATEWDIYAEEHDLPKHKLFYERLGLEVLSKYTDKKVVWNKDNIQECLLEYFPESPPTTTQWNKLRETNNVPTAMMIIRRYGTWNKMKEEVYE